jgi:hypothetical protein
MYQFMDARCKMSAFHYNLTNSDARALGVRITNCREMPSLPRCVSVHFFQLSMCVHTSFPSRLLHAPAVAVENPATPELSELAGYQFCDAYVCMGSFHALEAAPSQSTSQETPLNATCLR